MLMLLCSLSCCIFLCCPYTLSSPVTISSPVSRSLFSDSVLHLYITWTSFSSPCTPSRYYYIMTSFPLFVLLLSLLSSCSSFVSTPSLICYLQLFFPFLFIIPITIIVLSPPSLLLFPLTTPIYSSSSLLTT